MLIAKRDKWQFVELNILNVPIFGNEKLENSAYGGVNGTYRCGGLLAVL
jgi:hypothetical protein